MHHKAVSYTIAEVTRKLARVGNYLNKIDYYHDDYAFHRCSILVDVDYKHGTATAVRCETTNGVDRTKGGTYK